MIEPDLGLASDLTIDGDPVSLLWTLALTQAEAELKLREGLRPFLQLLDDRQLPFVLEERRESLV